MNNRRKYYMIDEFFNRKRLTKKEVEEFKRDMPVLFEESSHEKDKTSPRNQHTKSCKNK